MVLASINSSMPQRPISCPMPVIVVMWFVLRVMGLVLRQGLALAQRSLDDLVLLEELDHDFVRRQPIECNF